MYDQRLQKHDGTLVFDAVREKEVGYSSTAWLHVYTIVALLSPALNIHLSLLVIYSPALSTPLCYLTPRWYNFLLGLCPL